MGVLLPPPDAGQVTEKLRARVRWMIDLNVDQLSVEMRTKRDSNPTAL
jgi:hypothetical protein